jgi:hypothetical protein
MRSLVAPVRISQTSGQHGECPHAYAFIEGLAAYLITGGAVVVILEQPLPRPEPSFRQAPQPTKCCFSKLQAAPNGRNAFHQAPQGITLATVTPHPLAQLNVSSV